MPSEKVTRILKKRGLSEIEIAALSEQNAWDRVYATEAKKREKGQEICFTGFTDAEKSELAEAAKGAGLKVVTKVTVGLFMLCMGDTPGASKVKQAMAQGSKVVSHAQLEAFIRTGEIPA